MCNFLYFIYLTIIQSSWRLWITACGRRRRRRHYTALWVCNKLCGGKNFRLSNTCALRTQCCCANVWSYVYEVPINAFLDLQLTAASHNSHCNCYIATDPQKLDIYFTYISSSSSYWNVCGSQQKKINKFSSPLLALSSAFHIAPLKSQLFVYCCVCVCVAAQCIALHSTHIQTH